MPYKSSHNAFIDRWLDICVEWNLHETDRDESPPPASCTSSAALDTLAERLVHVAQQYFSVPSQSTLEVQEWCDRFKVNLRSHTGPQEGTYFRGNPTSAVSVRAGTSANRARMVVAHELGHHLLELARGEADFRRELDNESRAAIGRLNLHDDEEKVADAVSLALLMPRSSVIKWVGLRKPTLDLIHCSASYWSVPAMSAAQRLHTLGLAQGAFLRAQIRDDKVQVIAWSQHPMIDAEPRWLILDNTTPGKRECGGLIATQYLRHIRAEVHISPSGTASIYALPSSTRFGYPMLKARCDAG